MNEIPSSGPEREAYIISVMQGVKREGRKVVNLLGTASNVCSCSLPTAAEKILGQC